ncbi:ABC transporter ATP-binding protein [Cryptosporangium sp. NPDC051539]|uniref:ABC transporter ATP-binding protein n=1 Tax=Cryptosporangium sp. NPDC051539 TaxID=3363962 RepID=UPI0037907238
MTVSLTMSDVRVTLGHNPVLKGISLDVAEGEFVTLLGASGSGKSTLLNVVAGLQPMDSGELRFGGDDVRDTPPRKRNVGVVFQSYALFPHMTVGDNVGFPLRAAKRPAAERRRVAAEMLDLVQLTGMADRSPASLSGGQRQRVALARALAANPAVLLLDEPMAALDKQLRERMQVEIKRIQQEVGITTIAVTHDQTEALTMSDRVAIMHEGCLVQVDSPKDLYRRPVNAYVATFLGEANLLPIAGSGLKPAASAHATTGTAVIRPEDLVLVDADTPDNGWVVEGVTRMVSYQGTRYRLELETPDGARVVASLPASWDADDLVPGRKARLGCLDASRVHVIGVEAAVAPLTV